jgi:superfamily II RNA helicase
MEQIKYKEFILDPFQIDSVKSIEKNNSVVVSAATGTGKTLIADYAINKFKNLNKRVVYTAPIKALSNQKYRDFKKEYGEENVGLMTGDIVLNPHAHLLIMTTEIYRNMLVTKDPIIETISYVIFDEIHFMSDIERGTVWEESIIFSPNTIRFLCLSATIPNAKEFAEWIQSIKHHTVDIVIYHKRAVPLEHNLFDIEHGIVPIQKAKQMSERSELPDYYKVMKRNRRNKRSNEKPKMPMHYDLIKILKQQNELPCIFFVFSRKGCEIKADELASKQDFLDNNQKTEVVKYFNSMVKEEYRYLESVKLLKRVLQKGIGIHHAGLLPVLKEIVENLFSKSIIKVLYATETFAVGINMPAKAVCFNSLVKFSGTGFNFMRTKEYFQMAGRAGRRGIDSKGKVVSILERRSELDKIVQLTSSDSEPIISQFKLGPNTVLNMLNNHTEEEREIILKSNFDYFLKQKQDYGIRIKARFNNWIKKLMKLGYVTDKLTLTNKGLFATQIYSNEILVTELFSGDIYKRLSDNELSIIIGAIIYEYRRSDRFYETKNNKRYLDIVRKVAINPIIRKDLNEKAIRDLSKVITSWANGCKFEELMEMSEYEEGDYIRLFRQMVDLMNQIRKASNDRELQERIITCMNRIYRDVIKFEF